MHPRSRFAGVTVGAVALVVALVLGAAPASAATTVAVHVPSGTTLRVADQVGQFEVPLQVAGVGNFPFTVQYSSFVGAPAVFQAFASGDVDLSLGGDNTIIPPQVAGQNFEVVATYIDPNFDFGLIEAPGENATAIDKKTLIGKKIGFEFGTNAQAYVLRLLKANGLTPSQVDLVNLPEASLVSALKSGSVDYIETINPLTFQFLPAIPGAKVIHTPQVASGRLWIVANRSAVDNPATSAAIASYLEHFSESLAYIDKHPQAFVQAYYVGEEKLPASIVPPIVKTFEPYYTQPIDSSVIQQQQQLTNLFTQAGFINEHLDVSKVFTTKYNEYVTAGELQK
jgi:sulfonate transport system substrate-binding protein